MIPYLQRYNLLIGDAQVMDVNRVTAADYAQAYVEAVELFHDVFDRILTNESVPTYENTIRPYLVAIDTVGRIHSAASTHSDVWKTPEMIEVCASISGKYKTLCADIMQNKVFFARFETVSAQSDMLSPPRRRIIQKLAAEFEDYGISLDPLMQARLKEIDIKINDLTKKQFQETVHQSALASALYIEAAEELSGLENKEIEGYAEAARKAGHDTGYLVDITDRLAVDRILQQCSCRTTRKEIYNVQNAIGTSEPHATEGIIREISELRAERANILGYSTYADYILRDRMVGGLEKLNVFLQSMQDQLLPHYRAEVAAVTAYANAHGHAGKLQPWDIDYWTEQYKQHTFSIDMKALEPYLQVTNVINSLVAHAGNLYDLELVAAPDLPVQDPAVSAYRVYDKATKILKGTFILDLFSRPETKSGGAWELSYRNVDAESDTPVPCVVGVHMNLNPNIPVISFSDVETAFHEFGHGMHELIGQDQEADIIRGTNVQYDFVEMPSQFLENFVQDPMFMSDFLRHNVTGEPCPIELLKGLRDYSNFGFAQNRLKVVQNSQYDLAMHTDPERRRGTLAEIMRRETLDAEISPLTKPYPLTRFPHLWSDPVGYSAGYYSYVWSSVLDAQVYASFEVEGYDFARRKLKQVLAVGGAEDANQLFTRHYGPINSVHLLQRMGISVHKKSLPVLEPSMSMM